MPGEKTLKVWWRSTETQSTYNIVVEVEGVIDVHCAILTSQGVQHRVFYLDGHPSRYQPGPTRLKFSVSYVHTTYFFQGHTVARSTPVEVCFSPDAQYVISGMANSFIKTLHLEVFPIEIKRKESQGNY